MIQSKEISAILRVLGSECFWHILTAIIKLLRIILLYLKSFRFRFFFFKFLKKFDSTTSLIPSRPQIRIFGWSFFLSIPSHINFKLFKIEKGARIWSLNVFSIVLFFFSKIWFHWSLAWTKKLWIAVLRWKKAFYGNNETKSFPGGKNDFLFSPTITYNVTRRDPQESRKWEDLFMVYD